MEVNCENCAGCCIDRRALSGVDRDRDPDRGGPGTPGWETLE